MNKIWNLRFCLLFPAIGLFVISHLVNAQSADGLSRMQLDDATGAPVVRVESDGGVLGQPIIVRVIVENPTIDFIALNVIRINHGQTTIVPLSRMDALYWLPVMPRERVVYEIPLLWNAAPSRVAGAKTKIYTDEDRVIFTNAGPQVLSLTTNVLREPWPVTDATRSRRRLVHKDLVLPVTVNVKKPVAGADQDWWALARKNPQMLKFLDGGLPSDEMHEVRVFEAIRGFVKKYPDEPLARRLDESYKRIMASRAEAERLNRR